MNSRKPFAVPFLLLMLMLLVVGAASGASILTSANQIGQAVSPASNNGSFTISSMQVVNSNGRCNPSSGLCRRIMFLSSRGSPGISSPRTQPQRWHYFQPGRLLPFEPSAHSTVFAASMRASPPGFPSPVWAPTFISISRTDQNKTPIIGKLNLRVMGYLATIN